MNFQKRRICLADGDFATQILHCRHNDAVNMRASYLYSNTGLSVSASAVVGNVGVGADLGTSFRRSTYPSNALAPAHALNCCHVGTSFKTLTACVLIDRLSSLRG